MSVLVKPPAKPVIYSVRHGESIGNAHRAFYKRIPDWGIFLTPKGQQQGKACGDFFVNLFGAMPEGERPKKVRIIHTSYVRGAQTSQFIEDALRASGLIEELTVKEDDRLREQDFAYSNARRERPEHERWLTALLLFNGLHWYARREGGESPADMEPRVRLVLDAIYRDFHENGITHFIIVNHGVTSRVLTKVVCEHSVVAFGEDPNPDNCAVRLLENKTATYLFPHATGQWNPEWKPKTQKKGNPAHNPGGLFFTREEQQFLIDLQDRCPPAMEALAAILANDETVTATDAIRQLLSNIEE